MAITLYGQVCQKPLLRAALLALLFRISLMKVFDGLAKSYSERKTKVHNRKQKQKYATKLEYV